LAPLRSIAVKVGTADARPKRRAPSIASLDGGLRYAGGRELLHFGRPARSCLAPGCPMQNWYERLTTLSHRDDAPTRTAYARDAINQSPGDLLTGVVSPWGEEELWTPPRPVSINPSHSADEQRGFSPPEDWGK